MKTLILYYSYGGNTKRIAEMIRKETFLSAITEQQIKIQKYPAHLRKQNP